MTISPIDAREEARQRGMAMAVLMFLLAQVFSAAAAETNFVRAIEAARASGDADAAWRDLETHFPIECDWLRQDFALPRLAIFASDTLPALKPEAAAELGLPERQKGRWEQTLPSYLEACEQRRERRLGTVRAAAPRIVFTKRRTIRPSFFAYTEGQSDAQQERHFPAGSELCVAELEGRRVRVRTLLSDPKGAIRDPAVSWDGRQVLFAWKKSLNEDDYHLYEMEAGSGAIRQITSGRGFADYEPAYLPNGEIVFASTRCVQTTDCFWTEVSNLYTCDREGRYLRRLGFDQVHTVYPQVLEDGRVIYTRWDYNDRGQVFPQALFVMNPNGTAQGEFYGNNSWFPTTIAHARGIPGTQRVLAIFCGHHTAQAGKLGVIDPAKGRQENSGAQLVAPARETPAARIDAYGQEGELFQYPYPLSTNEFLVTYAPDGWENSGRRTGDARFAIHWMNLDGQRELLISDAALPCSQPVPLMPRTRPPARPSDVDYTQNSGSVYLQDVYAGPGLQGVPRGTIKKLRAVALEYRAAGIGENHSGGPGGGALISTPIATGNGAWDVKAVLGEATVHEDGSAFFTAPARTPFYFQALDGKGRAVQTMRSWTTLQPGETQSCAGCHESKNAAPGATSYAITQALRAGAKPLAPFYGPTRGFSFRKEIQPILDRHCVRCHDDREAAAAMLEGQKEATRETRNVPAGAGPKEERSFSLLGAEILDTFAKRRWSESYLVLTQSRRERETGAFRGKAEGTMVWWISSQSVPSALPAYSGGSTRSPLMALLDRGHKEVKLSREETEKLACWIDLTVPFCGDYVEANAWTEAEKAKYQRYAEKRERMRQLEERNIRELLQTTQPAAYQGSTRKP